MRHARRFAAILALLGLPLSGLPAPHGDEGGAYTVTDSLGRRVAFQTVPSRIFLGGRSVQMVADALYVFPQAWGRLLGTTEIDQGIGNFLTAVDPHYGQKVTLPGTAGVEQIAALRPDAVVLKSFMAPSLGRGLEALGIPVVYVDFEEPQQYERDLFVLGRMLRDEERAREVWRVMQGLVRPVTELTAPLEKRGRPTALFLYDAPREGGHVFNVPPAGWIQTRLTEMAGARPVWTAANPGGGWSRVGFEQIAAWNPDWVFVVSYHNDVDRIVASLREDPAWAALAATRGGRVVAFPADYYSWDQPDVRWVLGLRWMASRIHPELFPGVDLEADARRFFSFLYGMDEAAVSARILARLRGGFRAAR